MSTIKEINNKEKTLAKYSFSGKFAERAKLSFVVKWYTFLRHIVDYYIFVSTI